MQHLYSAPQYKPPTFGSIGGRATNLAMPPPCPRCLTKNSPDLDKNILKIFEGSNFQQTENKFIFPVLRNLKVSLSLSLSLSRD
jgi:hypothetical protein